MEVWKIMFLSRWVICRFQPLIFQSVTIWTWSHGGSDGSDDFSFSIKGEFLGSKPLNLPQDVVYCLPPRKNMVRRRSISFSKGDVPSFSRGFQGLVISLSSMENQYGTQNWRWFSGDFRFSYIGEFLASSREKICQGFSYQQYGEMNPSNLVGGWTNPFEKYARQSGSFPQVKVKIKSISNHQPVLCISASNMANFGTSMINFHCYVSENRSVI